MRKSFFCLLIILLITGAVKAQPQKIQINVNKQPLNEVLLLLREQYGFELAYNEGLTSRYRISLKKEFNSKEEAISELLSSVPFGYELADGVFMILPGKNKQPKKKWPLNYTTLTGQVLEAQSYEPLPFSNILANNKPVTSDQNGNFSFIASTDSVVSLQISHLGYFIFDTVFKNSSNTKFYLTPSVEEIDEVQVEGFTVEKATLIGDSPGRMKINHTIAPYLPGYGDNSVYNLLRLMPGVLASGEQSTDLLVWGGYEGHSKIEFDGFTVFGLKNYNDNIGIINPLLIKNVQVFKGGYEAKYGDRVGGIVKVFGKNGNFAKPTLTFNINNSTASSLVEIPLGKKSSLLAAYRQTYYELYDPYDLNIFGRRGNTVSQGQQKGKNNVVTQNIDFVVSPEYKFRDANFKYTYQGENSSVFSASFYGGGDRYLYDMEGEVGNYILKRNENEKNDQLGGSVFYGQPWGKGNNSKVTVSYSGLSNSTEEINSTIRNNRFQKETIQKNVAIENSIQEISAEFENTLALVNGHYIDIGLGYKLDDILLQKTAFLENQINLNSIAERGYLFLQDNLPIGKHIELTSGVRATYSKAVKKFYVEPRISASVKITDALKVNASWGKYHQFVTKTSLVDSSLNYTWFWVNSDNVSIPVLEASHWVGGVSYNKNDWMVCVEGYYKKTDGITRYFNGTERINKGFYSGSSNSYGIDLFVKKEYKKNVAWISYTLSKVEEKFPFYILGNYRAAPHDQRHEFKAAGIYNLKSFYFSANYVYGSGFEILRNFISENESLPIYSRLDAAVTYKFKTRKIFGEIGLSVLNVTNYQNIKYSNLKRIPTEDSGLLNVNSEAVPFTPMLFLKLKL